MKSQSFNGEKLAKEILKKREAENLTFRKIDEQTKGELPYSSLQRIEACQVVPSAVQLGKVCTWLKQPVSNFFN